MTAPLPTASPKRLEERLGRIVGERNPFTSPAHLAEVERYLEGEFESCGLTVESDRFAYRGRSFRNIVGRRGPARDGPLILLGAHLDSVEGSPGADDNASGLAVLLEAARILSQLPLRRETLFCAFNLEEMDMIGSSHFARKLKSARVSVDAMVSLEMVGFTNAEPGGQRYPAGLKWFYPDRGDFIGVVGNWRSASLLRRFCRSMREVGRLPVESLTVLGNGFLVPQVRLSDHSPFWDLGYPALLVTDTAFFRNPYYHGPNDTLKTLDLDFMAKVCQGVVRAIAKLAGL